jgi:hypothetical protein
MRQISLGVRRLVHLFNLVNICRISNLHRLLVRPVTAMLMLALTACGGGSASVSLDAALTGRFIDSPVQGLQYRTATQAGETNANGEFRYLPGETVVFAIGDLIVGHAVGASQVTPFELAGTLPQAAFSLTQPTANSPSALEHAANVAVILQTFDEDGDPTNGITIPTQLRSLTNGMILNFHQKSDAFQIDNNFRRLMIVARKAGLWGGTRAIRKASQALRDMTVALAVQPNTYLESEREERSYGNQNSIRRITDFRDASGYLTKRETDNGADGTIDLRENFARDANGNVITYEQFQSGVLTYRATSTYDANGNRTLHTQDNNADGTIDNETKHSYDSNGNLTLSEMRQDGILRNRLEFIYDANGERIRDEIQRGDGTVQTRTIYALDANGGRIQYYQVLNVNGTFAYTRTSYFDTVGNVTKAMEDIEGDGTIDQETTYSYNSNGQLTRTATVSIGNDSLFVESKNGYDANGNEVIHEELSQGTLRYRLESKYDAKGNRTEQIEHAYDYASGGGYLETRFINYFDSNNNRTKMEVDYQSDGTIDYEATFAFDKSGNQTEYKQLSHGSLTYQITSVFALVDAWIAFSQDIDP